MPRLSLALSLSICLVDLNYNKRSHAQDCIAQADETLKNISSLIREAFIQWEEEIDDLSICDNHCCDMKSEHEVKDLCNNEYNVKWQCVEAIAKLLKTCL